MSVRATERLIGSLVKVTALPRSPQMVVSSVDIEKKTVITAWFSDKNEFQEGFFPSNALDRVDLEKPKAPAKQSKPKPKPKAKAKPGKR